jgi:hypothetical protein
MEVRSIPTFRYDGRRRTRYWRFLTVPECPKAESTPGSTSERVRCQVEIVIGEVYTTHELDRMGHKDMRGTWDGDLYTGLAHDGQMVV